MIIAPAILALVVLASAALADGRASGETVVAALGLLLVVVLALVATQRLVGQLTRLRDSALTAANRVLPERIEQIRASRDPSGRTPEELIRDAADPVAVPAHDELGQVAYAVNTMYQEALRAAAGQARQRGELDTLVSGLARRSQALAHGGQHVQDPGLPIPVGRHPFEQAVVISARAQNVPAEVKGRQIEQLAFNQVE